MLLSCIWGDIMNIDYKEIGKRIAKRRKELGLKQYEVCEMIDVNYKYLSNLETGRSAPSLELIMSLCKSLNATPDYFLLGTEQEHDPNDSIETKIASLSPQQRTLVNGIIDLIKKQG